MHPSQNNHQKKNMLNIKQLCAYAQKGLQEILNELVLFSDLNKCIVEYAFDTRDMWFIEFSSDEAECQECAWKCIFQEQRDNQWNVENLAQIILTRLDHVQPFSDPDWKHDFWTQIFGAIDERKDKQREFPRYCEFEKRWKNFFGFDTETETEQPQLCDFVSPLEVAKIYSKKNISLFIHDINKHLKNDNGQIRITLGSPFV
jgi:hypothetical protein